MRVLLISANKEKINMPLVPLGLACVAAAGCGEASLGFESGWTLDKYKGGWDGQEFSFYGISDQRAYSEKPDYHGASLPWICQYGRHGQ